MAKIRIGFSKDLSLTDGNLGIGTSNSSNVLSVLSPSTGDSILQLVDNTPIGSMFRVNNSVGYPLMDVDSDGTVLFPTGGNVGIGSITSPAYKLDINGSMRVSDTLYINSISGNGSGLTNISLTQFAAPGIQGQMMYNSGSLISATPYYFYDAVNTRIGIGTTNPASRFSISNPSTGESILQVGDNITSGSMFRVNNSTGYPLMDIDGDGTILFLTPGNVSIGPSVTSPAYKLEVGGDLRVGTASTQGIILTSPNGTRYRVTINDAGTLSSAAI